MTHAASKLNRKSYGFSRSKSLSQPFMDPMTKTGAAEAGAELQWEDLAIFRTIEVENINDLYISRMKEKLSSAQGFGWRGWVAASQFYAILPWLA